MTGPGIAAPALSGADIFAAAEERRRIKPLEIVQWLDGEARLCDLRLGERLRLHRPRDVRKLIANGRGELARCGMLATERYDPDARASVLRGTSRELRGRRGRVYYLNEGQALAVCALVGTRHAEAVGSELKAAFAAFRNDRDAAANSAALDAIMGSIAGVRVRLNDLLRELAAGGAVRTLPWLARGEWTDGNIVRAAWTVRFTDDEGRPRQFTFPDEDEAKEFRRGLIDRERLRQAVAWRLPQINSRRRELQS